MRHRYGSTKFSSFKRKTRRHIDIGFGSSEARITQPEFATQNIEQDEESEQRPCSRFEGLTTPDPKTSRNPKIGSFILENDNDSPNAHKTFKPRRFFQGGTLRLQSSTEREVKDHTMFTTRALKTKMTVTSPTSTIWPNRPFHTQY